MAFVHLVKTVHLEKVIQPQADLDMLIVTDSRPTYLRPERCLATATG